MSGEPRAAELERLRGEIEAVDRGIVDAFAERVRIARRIGELKEEEGWPVLDPSREVAVVRRAAELARARGLDEEEVREIFWRLVGLSRRRQREERGGARG
jgi:chorismate mutase